MGSYADEPNEFTSLLESAREYDGFEEETSDEDAPEEGTQDAGEGLEDGEDTEPEDAEEGTEEDGDEPSYEVTLPGGQKVMVPLSELAAGYSRTQDYTRKTQALAAERRDLADAAAILQALNRNPAAAIQALAKAYEVDGTGQEPEEYLSDEDRWRREVDARFQAQDRAQREAAIDAEVARLHQEYGEFDEEALFTHAVATNTMNLEVALRAMQFEVLRGQQSKQAQRTQQVRQAKKAAAAAPPSGRSSKGTAPVVPDSDISTFTDAYEYAKRILNRS